MILKAGNAWDDRIVQVEAVETTLNLDSRKHGKRIIITRVAGKNVEIKFMTGNGRNIAWEIFATKRVAEKNVDVVVAAMLAA